MGALLLIAEPLLPPLAEEARPFEPKNQTRKREKKPRFSDKEQGVAGALLHHAVQTLRDAGVEEILCVLDQDMAFLQSVAQELKLQVVYFSCEDNEYNSDPLLCAVRSGLNIVSSYWDVCMLMPFNMPFLRAHSVKLLRLAAQNSDKPVLRLSLQGEKGYPSTIDRTTYNTFLIRDSDKGLPGILELFHAQDVETPDSGIWQPIRSDEDYARFFRQQRKGARPDLAGCQAIWDYCGTKEKIWPHLRMVAEIAQETACQLAQKGCDIDPELAFAGAMLHGVAKGERDAECMGARWVADLGYPAVADIIASSRDLPEDALDKLDERAIVFWADKLVRHNRPCSIQERYVRSLELAADNPEIVVCILRRRDMARRVQSKIFAKLGLHTGTLNVLDVLRGGAAVLVSEAAEDSPGIEQMAQAAPQDPEGLADNVVEWDAHTSQREK